MWYKKWQRFGHNWFQTLVPLGNARTFNMWREYFGTFCICLLDVVGILVKLCFLRDKHLILSLLRIRLSKPMWICRKWGPRVSLGVQEVDRTRTWPWIVLVWEKVRVSAALTTASFKVKWFTWRIILGKFAIFWFCCERVIECPILCKKSEFRSKVLKVAKSKIEVEVDVGKKTKGDVVVKAVMGENAIASSTRQCNTCVSWQNRRWSNLVLNLILFQDWPVSITMFCCVCRNLKQSTVIGIYSRASSLLCRELSRRECTLSIFKLCCLCLGFVVPSLRKVELGSGRVGTVNVDLSCIIKPLQGHLLSSNWERISSLVQIQLIAF